MHKNDIVYVLKNDIKPNELRYSLRSVCENFPYRKIWFYGGCPDGIRPDGHVELIQSGESKHQRVRSMLRAIMDNGDITENFWLFNDDFFVWQPIKDELPPICIGTLFGRATRIEAKHGQVSPYTKLLRETALRLKEKGFDRLDYEGHLPMLINREHGMEILNKFHDGAFRSTYGNYYNIRGMLMDDVKIVDPEEYPTEDMIFVSTSDQSFKAGAVGKCIRSKFQEPCKYETDKEPLPEESWLET